MSVKYFGRFHLLVNTLASTFACFSLKNEIILGVCVAAL